MQVEDIPSVSFLALIVVLCFVGIGVICPDEREEAAAAEKTVVPERAELEPIVIDGVKMEPTQIKLKMRPPETRIIVTSLKQTSMNVLAADGKTIIHELRSEDSVRDISILDNPNNHLKVTYTLASSGLETQTLPDGPTKSTLSNAPHHGRTYNLKAPIGQPLTITGVEVTPEEEALVRADFEMLGKPAELIDLNAVFFSALPERNLKPNQEFTLKDLAPETQARLERDGITAINITYIGTRAREQRDKTAVFFVNVQRETAQTSSSIRGEIGVDTQTGSLMTRKLFGQIDEGLHRRGTLRIEETRVYGF